MNMYNAVVFLCLIKVDYYWKWNFPMSPHVRLSVAPLVCHNFKFNLPCSYRSTCSLNVLQK